MQDRTYRKAHNGQLFKGIRMQSHSVNKHTVWRSVHKNSQGQMTEKMRFSRTFSEGWFRNITHKYDHEGINIQKIWFQHFFSKLLFPSKEACQNDFVVIDSVSQMLNIDLRLNSQHSWTQTAPASVLQDYILSSHERNALQIWWCSGITDVCNKRKTCMFPIRCWFICCVNDPNLLWKHSRLMLMFISSTDSFV